MSKRMKEAWERFQNETKGVSAFDDRFNNSVVINHEDGSHFFFACAFIWEPSEFSDNKSDWPWVCVGTEHQGDHIFAKDDLSFWRQL